jgi:uncharacterized membrane protein
MRQVVSAYQSAYTESAAASGCAHQEQKMSKEQHGNKEAKKKPLLTPKEKKAAKQAKKHAHDAPVFLPNQQAPGH